MGANIMTGLVKHDELHAAGLIFNQKPPDVCLILEALTKGVIVELNCTLNQVIISIVLGAAVAHSAEKALPNQNSASRVERPSRLDCTEVRYLKRACTKVAELIVPEHDLLAEASYKLTRK
jgi:hypothetical protein